MELHKSITTLPFRKFIQCKVQGHIRALIINGKPSKQDMQAAWNSIEFEYDDAINNEEHDFYTNMSTLLFRAASHTYFLEEGFKILRKRTHGFIESPHIDEGLIVVKARVNEVIHTNFLFDCSNYESCTNELNQVETMLNNAKFFLKFLRVVFSPVKEVYEETRAKKFSTYYKSILKIMGVLLTERKLSEEMPMYAFCDLLRQMNIYFSQLDIFNLKNEKPWQPRKN